MNMLQDLFLYTYKSVILFGVSLIIVRIMGKRTVAQLSPFDLIFIIILGSAIAIPLEDPDIKITNGIFPVVITSILNYLLSILIMKNRKIENFIQGKATVLVRKGEVITDNLKRERITIADLLVLLRENGVSNINEVEEAAIEPNGKLSVIKKEYMQTVTPKDLGLWSKQGIFPTIIISQGEVIQENLNRVGISIDLMLRQLSKKGIERLNEIKAAWIDEEGNMEVEKF